ncbi:MAG: hypothetical protein LBH85_01635 [Treponema sp.]|jgi:hypothetical protein|nr:hypothetical protein [Treponema sp.]
MINFMVELSKRSVVSPGSATPSARWGGKYNVYEIYTGKRPQNTYWTDWGGAYDNEETNKLEIYMDGWLYHAGTIEELKAAAAPAMYVDGNYIYINIPKHPWLYKDNECSMNKRDGYLYAPKNSGNPSDLYIDGSLYETRLDIPSISVKLSSPLSGLTRNSTFSATLANNDGKFDGEDSQEYFNAPMYIRKTTRDNPAYTDFITIREGLVEDIAITQESAEITSAEKYRSFDEPVCKAAEEIENKSLPVIFGRCVMPLIEIEETEYIEKDVDLDNDIDGIDDIDKKEDDTVTMKGAYLAGEGVRAVVGNAVYAEGDVGDIAIPCAFDSETGIITVEETKKKYTLTGVDKNGKPIYGTNAKTPKPKYVIVDGYLKNKTGQIVTALVERSGRLQYNESNWDVDETDGYIEQSPAVNIAFTGGDIKAAVAAVLKSDMAFLIQKNDGRLTLRKWGDAYDEHSIASWQLTQQPQKSFSDAQQNYFSSCVIKYGYNEYKKAHENQYRYADKADEAEGRYLKKVEKVFETHLTNETGAKNLASRLGNRFCELKDRMSAGVGVDTSEYNLLDTVFLKIDVNGRKYSNNDKWIIVEADPAQDKLVLEEA